MTAGAVKPSLNRSALLVGVLLDQQLPDRWMTLKQSWARPGLDGCKCGFYSAMGGTKLQVITMVIDLDREF